VKNIDHVRVHLAAREIAESAHVAYWLDGENNQVRDHHLRSVSEEFAKLAGLLGYRIEKIEERTCQITGFKFDAVVEEVAPHA
jgi:hypothetical protein